MTANFDHDWQLHELLDASTLPRIGAALVEVLGTDIAILDTAGKTLWGVRSPGARQEPLVVELAPSGYLASASASPPVLHGAAALLNALLRTEVRFKMASALHLEAVAEDFETLRREHAHLIESEGRYKTLAAELETRVQAQLAQLEERQQLLYQAEKLSAVGRLAAGMAHEINNPLGFVRSNLATFAGYLGKFAALKLRLAEGQGAWQSLDLDFILDDSADLITDSLNGVDRIARLVSDLKSFSNVDRATGEFADLNDCLRQVASVIACQLPTGVSLKLDLQTLPHLICLPGHLNQAFFNLVRNGVQAIADLGAPGDVAISSRHDADGIVITIADSGVGMDAALREQIGQPFFTTRPVGSGAGLGLATARNIIQAHSGTMAITSAPGTGTTVTVTFPVSP